MEKELEASATVEAALVMPIVIYVIIAIIWLTLYMCSDIMLTCVSGELMEKSRTLYLRGEEQDQSIYTAAGKQFREKRFPACEVSEFKIHRTGTRLHLEAELRMKLPAKGLMGELVKNLRSIRYEGEISLSDRSKVQLTVNELLKSAAIGEEQLR